jgi:ubiquinone/menaquinone biosynthesis C-methylase UbiE
MKHNFSVPITFNKPTKIPENEKEANDWQKKNKEWWENNPMRYDWNSDLKLDEFSKNFYLEIDRRFFLNASKYLPYRKIPFDALIPFKTLNDKTVLEIGVGNGSHAQLLAQHAKSYTGIDLTAYAIESTSKRLELYSLKTKLLQMDAEKMQFEDESFDFIWSWGVIHHSSNTEKILKEMQRVLRPNGTAITMIYHRGFWNYYFIGGLIKGILLGDLFKTRSICKTIQNITDGAIARYFSPSEWRSLTAKYFLVDKIQIFGSKAELIPIPDGKIKNFILRLIPNLVGRFFTNKLCFGSFLVSTLKKKSK